MIAVMPQPAKKSKLPLYLKDLESASTKLILHIKMFWTTKGQPLLQSMFSFMICPRVANWIYGTFLRFRMIVCTKANVRVLGEGDAFTYFDTGKVGFLVFCWTSILYCKCTNAKH